MNITWDRKNKKLWLLQQKYVERMLEKFNMKNVKLASTSLSAHFKLSKRNYPQSTEEKLEISKIPHASAISSLMYTMVYTQADIAHAIGVVKRFLSNPRKGHSEAVEWFLRYLCGTTKLCLQFGVSDLVLEGYTDSNMANYLDGRMSTLDYAFTFAGAVVS